VNGKINYAASTAPATSNDSSEGYRVGSMWIDTTNDEVYRCTDDAVDAALWIGTTLETTDLGSLAMVTPTGTGSATTFLRGDNSWTTVDTDLTSDVSPQLGGDLDTNGNDIKFKDNDRATFGDGNDLQIYHTGSTSYIQDTGDGSLAILGTNLYLKDSSGFNFIECLDTGLGGTVNLFHGGLYKKLATTSTGIDVTGGIAVSGTVDGRDIAADGLVLDSAASTSYVDSAVAGLVDSAPATLNTLNELALALGDDANHVTTMTNLIGTKLPLTGGTLSGAFDIVETNTAIVTDGASLVAGASLKINGNASQGSDNLRIGSMANGTGDYFIDVSNSASTASYNLLINPFNSGKVGIGTTSPNEKLHVAGNIAVKGIVDVGSASNPGEIKVTNNVYDSWILRKRRSDDTQVCGIKEVNSGGLAFLTGNVAGGDEKVIIKANGNVGIGTSSPVSKLHVHSTTNPTIYLTDDTLGSGYGGTVRGYGVTGSGGYLQLGVLDAGTYRRGIEMTAQLGQIAFYTSASQTERMRIDSNGNVGIGTSTPSSKLDVNGDINFEAFTCTEYNVGNVINFSNGVWRDIVALQDATDIPNPNDSTYLIKIHWTGGYNANTGGGTVYWAGCYSCVYGSEAISSTYNYTSGFPLNMNGSMHHTSAGFPEFQIDSDETAGSYGKPTLQMKVGFSGRIENIKVVVRRIM